MPPGAIPTTGGGYLVPNKPGQVIANSGRKKGSRSLSTVVRKIGERPINWDLMADNAKTLELKARFRKRTAFEAITIVATEQAMRGDNQAREWLRRAGYGDKMDVTTNDESLNATAVVPVSQEMAMDFAKYLMDKTKAPTVIELTEADIVPNKDK